MFFQRLEDLRVDADKTQEEIAAVLECRREVYRRYEKGVHEIPAWAVIKLAEYYGTSADYILGLVCVDTSSFPMVNTINSQHARTSLQRNLRLQTCSNLLPSKWQPNSFKMACFISNEKAKFIR